MKSQDTRLGYLLIATPATNVFIGGLMVINGRGLPVEFRYTEPIQPTKIQQILYGSVLTRYIKTEVILETLLKSLETKPQLLVVNDDCFLSKDLAIKDYDVIRLTETKSAPLKTPGKVEKLSPSEYLIQLTAESSPIRIQLSTEAFDPSENKGLPDKSQTSPDDFVNSPTYSLLYETGKVTDILEPLTRVEKALTALCQEAGIKETAN